jgi:hypothetical protein
MSTYTQNLYQVVFESKDHIPFLTIENEKIFFGYIAGIRAGGRLFINVNLRDRREIKK